MAEWIFEYWIEILFGLLVGFISFFFKKTINLYKKDAENKEKENEEKIYKEVNTKLEEERIHLDKTEMDLKATIANLMSQINELRIGILSIQGRQFKDYCRMLLQECHEITLSEYEECESEHAAYNNLGGNHLGDQLFELVKLKYQSNLTNPDSE